MTPFAPVNINANSAYFLKPAWKREFRPEFLGTKKPRAQSHISLKWRKKS